MNKIADGVGVKPITTGVKRYVATCEEHQDWRPGSHYDQRSAESDAEQHSRAWVHDRIDYSAMPATLADAITEITDPSLRRRIARAALHWRGVHP